MTRISETVVSFFYDALIFLFQIFLGVGAKLAIESRKRSITLRNVATSFVIACLVGYVTDSFCTSRGWDSFRGVAVPVSALISEGLVKYILENASSILDTLIRKKLGINKSSDKMAKD